MWLGLVSDDNLARYDDGLEDLTQEVDVAQERAVPATVTEIDTRRPVVVAQPSVLAQIVSVTPRTYNEARMIGENFRDGIPVIMNLTEMDDADAKRLVDFSAGLIFGLHGGIERITSKVFLLSPNNVNVTAEDKERIVGGFYNQS